MPKAKNGGRKRIIFAGGGTAGHVFPSLAVAEVLKRRGWECIFIGTKEGPEAKLVPAAGFPFHSVPAGKWRRYLSFQNLVDQLKLSPGVLKSIYLIRRLKPAVIFAKGGYGAVPVAIGGWLSGVPVIAHETDIIPGIANRVIGRIAKKICVSFPAPARGGKSPPLPYAGKKIVYTGNPIRSQLVGKQTARRRTQSVPPLPRGLPMILVLGGSQGAVGLNRLVFGAVEALTKQVIIVHQTGELGYGEAQRVKKSLGAGDGRDRYIIKPFFEVGELRQLYQRAKLVISRAGGTIFELTYFGLPSILIPLPGSAQNHQVANAKVYTRDGAGLVFEQEKITPGKLASEAIKLIHSPPRLRTMGQAAKEFSLPDAAKRVAEVIESVAK